MPKNDFLFLIILIGCLSPLALSASNDTIFRVATVKATPFVIYQENSSTISGFSVDLWDAIAVRLGIQYEWIRMNSLNDILQAVNSTLGPVSADASICETTINAARLGYMDFSQPIISGGLQIMTYKNQQSSSNKPALIFNALFSKLFWEVIGVILILIVVFAHLFYLIERRPKGKSSSVRSSYRYGGFEDSAWWASSILFTSGSDLMPITPLGRLLTFLCYIAACVLIAILQATITAQLTISSLQQPNGINGVGDLQGLNVGVLAASTSVTFLQQLGIGANFVYFDNSDDMLNAFTARKGNMAAVFFDAPVLLYYVNNQGASIADLVGPIYAPQEYGISFPSGSPWVKQVNLELLYLQQSSDQYEQIYNKWFVSTSSATSSGDDNILDPSNESIGLTWGFVALCVFAILGLFVFTHWRKRGNGKPMEGTSMESSDLHGEVDQEISNMQDALEDFGQRLQHLKNLAVQHRKRSQRIDP